MKKVVYFLMVKDGETHEVHFNNDPTDEDIDNYFEEKCGGVYKWWS